jgi:hypothetical protein
MDIRIYDRVGIGCQRSFRLGKKQPGSKQEGQAKHSRLTEFVQFFHILVVLDGFRTGNRKRVAEMPFYGWEEGF